MLATKSKNINVRVSEQVYNEIKNYSVLSGLSMSDFILETLAERLEWLEDVRDIKERLADDETPIDWEDVKMKADLL